MELPVHIKLTHEEAECSFTAYINFQVTPQVGHKIIIELESQLICQIIDIWHFLAPESNLIVTRPLVCSSYNELLTILDYFKASGKPTDFQSNVEPKSYYLFYRSVISALGLTEIVRPMLTNDPFRARVFVEVCRAIATASVLITLDHEVESLFGLVLCSKEPLAMLMVVQEFEEMINPDNLFKWDASDEAVEKCLTTAFEGMPNLPREFLPLCCRKSPAL